MLRKIERIPAKRDDSSYTFEAIPNQINVLLPAIKMVRNDRGGCSNQTKDGAALDKPSPSVQRTTFIQYQTGMLIQD